MVIKLNDILQFYTHAVWSSYRAYQ